MKRQSMYVMSRHRLHKSSLVWINMLILAVGMIMLQTASAFSPGNLQRAAIAPPEHSPDQRRVTVDGTGPSTTTTTTTTWPGAVTTRRLSNNALFSMTSLLATRKSNHQMQEMPHPPDTAPPRSILSASSQKNEEIEADSNTANTGFGFGSILKALKMNIGNKNNSNEKESKNSKHEQATLVEAPFFLNEGSKAVESSFESLEGGMDAGLQLTFTDEQLVKNKEEERKMNREIVRKLTSSITSTLASATSNNVMSPLIEGKVESQVSEQAIKGAILAGVFITALAGKGAAMSGAAGLGAAYVAITAGPVGQAVRALGGLTWDVANKGLTAYSEAEQQGKVDAALRTMAEYQLPETWDNIAAERALWDSKRPEYWNKHNELTRRSLLTYRLTLEARERTQQATVQAIEESHKLELAALQREQVKLAENSRLAAEEARLAAEARKLAEEMRMQEERAAVVEEEKRLRETERLEQEAKRLEQEARALEEETRRLEQEAEQVKRERREQEETARKAEKARLETEAKAKKALEEEEVRLQTQEERLLETARQAEQTRIANEKEAKAKEEQAKSIAAQKMKSGAMDNKRFDFEDDDEDDQFDEEDWEASIRAAQQSIDGNIAGLADSLSFVDDDAKADWDRASQKAQGLGGGRQRKPDNTVDEYDVEPDDMDAEALAIAARNAVKAFEEQAQTAEKGKKAQRQQWNDEMVTDSEIDDDDVFYDDGQVDYSDMSISKLKGELKRRGLPTTGGKKDLMSMLEEDDMAEDSFDEEGSGGDELEYFEMTVAELKEELQLRGLPTTGGKKDMVKRLEMDDRAEEDDSFEEDDFEELASLFGSNNINTGALNGAFAKGGVSSPNPTDLEDLARAAREAVEMWESGGKTDKQDWSAYTVAELREELNNRGLPTKGKKAELVALLQESDLGLAEAEGEDDLDDIDAGLAAREAFESMVFAPASADDEPSDEALWEIEQDAIAIADAAVDDYENMTIAQLKEELRGRGLRLSGKKGELIERLRASSS